MLQQSTLIESTLINVLKFGTLVGMTSLLASNPSAVPPGLKGVQVADTEIGAVRGSEGFYHYREHNAVELARTRRIEDVWHLLLHGSLDAPDSFVRSIGDARTVVVPTAALDLAASLPTHLGLISLLPLVVAPPAATIDQTDDERLTTAIATAAAVPTVLAALFRHRNGLAPIAADPSIGHAADWIRMATGTDASPEQVRLIEHYLIATIDHGFNASTFTTRVITSTGADIVGAFCGGVAALSGPLHGGAPSLALAMIEEIGDPANTDEWVRTRLDRGDKIMGFGHAVYRADDPRSAMLRQLAIEHGGELVDRAVEIERRTLAVLRAWKPDAPIVTNVEFFAGVVMSLAGLDRALFTPSFTTSRAVGWSAHIVEQAANNKIFRPSARYVGPEPASA